MTAVATSRGWRGWWRRHERVIAAGYLAAVAVLVLLLAARPTRLPILDRIQAMSDWWDGRWDRRLKGADSLVAGGRWQDAAADLERLDRDFPARNVRHFRDKQRERILQQLGLSYEALGDTARALATWDRLVAFDTLNYYNQYLRARAGERLMVDSASAAKVMANYAAVLKVFPNHLPSVRALATRQAAQQSWSAVVTGFAAYLDATFVQAVTVQAGDSTATAMVPADGRPHAVLLDLPTRHADAIAIGATGFALALDSVTVTAARTVGGAGSRVIKLSSDHVQASGMVRADRGAWIPAELSSALRLALPRLDSGTTSVRLVVRVFKPVDESLARLVADAARHTGADHAALEARTAVFASPAAADAAWWNQPWARQGLQFAVAAR